MRMHPLVWRSSPPSLPALAATRKTGPSPAHPEKKALGFRGILFRSLAALVGCGLAVTSQPLLAQAPDAKTLVTAPVISTSAPAVGVPSRQPRVPRDWNLRQTPIVDAVQRVRDAVVNIHSERTVQGETRNDSLLGRSNLEDNPGIGSVVPSQNRVNGMGTGIIIDPRGYIITNQHVVEDVNVIRVHLADGTVAGARVLGRDNESDLALLKIEVNRPLQVMPIGTAYDMRVGETVIAVGNAYGYSHTVTVGVVSAIGRDVTLNKEVSYKSLIQTDAAINPGNSGGPLINIWGELVGVNVAIRAGAQGIGFAIPVETMLRVSSQMLRQRGIGKGSNGGTVASGLQVRDVLLDRGGKTGIKNSLETTSSLVGIQKEEDKNRHGETEEDVPVRNVVVERVDQGSMAEKAGLQRGDVLVSANDMRLGSTMDVERAFLDVLPGDRIGLVIRRQGAEKTLQFTLEGGRPGAQASAEYCWRRLGLRLQPVLPEEVSRANPQLHGGMLVTEVRPDSTASKNGIQRGDILVGLHDWEMLNLDNVVFVLNHPNLASFSPLRFFVLRANQVHRGFLANLD